MLDCTPKISRPKDFCKSQPDFLISELSVFFWNLNRNIAESQHQKKINKLLDGVNSFQTSK